MNITAIDPRCKILETESEKILVSDTIKSIFNKKNGFTATWGKTIKDDPEWCEWGPLLADIEISKNGCPGYGTDKNGHAKLCRYCYKQNTNQEPVNMRLNTFKVVLAKLGPQVQQVAFGLTGVQTNPDLIPILAYCRSQGIVPNYTLTGADLTDEIAEATGRLAGAVAVSYHGDQELCFSTVRKMVGAGVRQVNIHAVTADKEEISNLIHNIHNDNLPLRALVLLSLKPKGRAKKMRNIYEEELGEVVNLARGLNINLGFDSCSAHKALSIYGEEYKQYIEPCESSLESIYCDVDGNIYPCSFGECEEGVPSFNILEIEDFLQEVWRSDKMKVWRQRLLDNKRSCPLFSI